MRFSILTLGCKANQSESFEIESYLISAGHELVEITEKPDICIINTCTVTAKSDYQSRQLIRRSLRAGSKVIVTGCYSNIRRDEISRMDGAIKVIPNEKKYEIINELTKNTSIETLDFSRNRSRYFLKVQDGCNYSCAYCIIPVARGRSRSLQPDEIINKIKIASSNYKEIVLTGIHLGTYGLDLQPQLKLSSLIYRILLETSIQRIRISSLEIREIDDQLLDLLSDRRICPHLHIPLQSGDDAILQRMKRNYRINDFLKGIYKIIKRFPDISLGTDIIVGFPGEGEGEFNNTKKLIEFLPFSYLHVFPYSLRPGTEAVMMRPHVPDSVKKQRALMIREIGNQKRLYYMKNQTGKVLDVIVEKRLDDGYLGLSGNYLRIKILSETLPLRDLVSIRVSEMTDGKLLGHPIGKL